MQDGTVLRRNPGSRSVQTAPEHGVLCEEVVVCRLGLLGFVEPLFRVEVFTQSDPFLVRGINRYREVGTVGLTQRQAVIPARGTADQDRVGQELRVLGSNAFKAITDGVPIVISVRHR